MRAWAACDYINCKYFAGKPMATKNFGFCFAAKEKFQSPVGACLKKLISDPVGVTADENWLFVAGILVAGLYVDPPILFLIFVMSWSLSNCNRKSCKKSDHEKFVRECPHNAYCLSYY